MSADVVITLGTLCLLVVALVSNRVGPDTALLGALTLLMVCGVISPVTALAGFADPSVLTIAALFVVATGLTETGAMGFVATRILGRPKTLAGAQIRLMAPVACMSAFMNNTPIVALYMPIVQEWSKRLRISPSRLFMPLSFAAILGGACTLIGTSTNLAVTQLYLTYFAEHEAELQATYGLTAPSTAKQFWWIAVVGVPATIVGIPFVAFTSKWLLPSRVSIEEEVEGGREYTIEMVVPPRSPIAGKSIEQADLRRLPGIYLAEIDRDGMAMPAPGPETILEEGDRVVFAGVVGSVVDLLKGRGLVPATNQVEKIDADRRDRAVVEAVISHGSPLVRTTVRQSQFRTRYNAAIIAVHRGGQRIKERIGDIRLLPGDTLLLLTHRGFVSAHRNSQDFYLVSDVNDNVDVRHERAWVALAIMGLLIALLTLPTGAITTAINNAAGTSLPETGFPPVVVAFLAAVLMVYTRCCTGTVARRSINWQVLLVIGAAIGVGKAMDKTGTARLVADTLFAPILDLGPSAMVFAVFMITTIVAQFVTNKGAAVLMFPIVMVVGAKANMNPELMVLTLMVGAACSFMSPVGFVTNLMVLGPGGYRFTDYVRLGLPLTLVIGLITAIVAPLAFPAHPTP